MTLFFSHLLYALGIHLCPPAIQEGALMVPLQVYLDQMSLKHKKMKICFTLWCFFSSEAHE